MNAAPSAPARAQGPRTWFARVLLGSGLLLAAVALLDPLRPGLAWWGAALAIVGLWLSARGDVARGLCALALAWAVGALVRPEFRADAFEFFVYLPSLAFDGDLDLHDDWLQMGFDDSPPPTPLGRTRNRHAVGPALVWAPFYAVAHVYVVADGAWGAGRHLPDGHALPYRRSAAMGTIAVALAGAALLARVLARRFERGVAWLAVGALWGASPLLYYVFVAPAMSHGLTFGLAAALIWACERARRAPGTPVWLGLGALFGLLVAVRWQAAVCGLLVAPVVLGGLRRGTARLRDACGAALLALLAFSPQMLVWRALYGRLLTMPQGSGFVDWSAPHALDTLFSADRGLFTWTPLLLLGLIGLLVGLRRAAWLHVPALLIVGATAWVNGGADDWAGSEAFGARRFDLVLPFLAHGLALVFEGLRRFALRRPLLAPALVAAAFVAWNVGLVTLYRHTRYEGPLRLERLAADQALQFRRAAEDAFGALFGARGRAFAYRLFAADYLDTQARPGGRIALARVDDADLRGRWSQVRRLAAGPAFRFAYPPEACLLIPQAEPRALSAEITMRPLRVARDVGLRLNGHDVAHLYVDGDWQRVAVDLPAWAFLPGPNWLCLTFVRAPDDGDDEPAVAVALFARRAARRTQNGLLP